MKQFSLILYTRRGCCLCEGLEERLRKTSFGEFNFSIDLLILDIDGEGITDLNRARYNLEVPVLGVLIKDQDKFVELPRVSPRLKGQEFYFWLERSLERIFDSLP